MGTTTTLLTFEEFERLPDQPGKRELLDGELIELPPSDLKHSRSSHKIYHRVLAAVEAAHARGEATNLGEVFIEVGYKLSRKSYVQPDVSVTHAAQPEGKYFGLAPAIAIEVISPSDREQDIDMKTQVYFRYGALEVWRFYAKNRHVVVHVGTTSRIERETVTTPLLPGFTLDIAEILSPAEV